jgi:hypothetical protein
LPSPSKLNGNPITMLRIVETHQWLICRTIGETWISNGPERRALISAVTVKMANMMRPLVNQRPPFSSSLVASSTRPSMAA